MTRDEWASIEHTIASDAMTRMTHAGRCEEQGHQWENCLSVMLQTYQRCKWCGRTSAFYGSENR